MPFEFSILDFIRRYLFAQPLSTIMLFFTTIGDYGLIWILLACLMLLKKGQRRSGFFLLLSLVFTGALCSGVLKPLFHRIRPCDINLSVVMLLPRPLDGSFPSGHTAASFAAFAVLLNERSILRHAALFVAILIAFSRLYLYVHFPTDVLCGALIGFAVGWAVARVDDASSKHSLSTHVEISA